MSRKRQMQKQTDTSRQGPLGTLVTWSSLVGLQPGDLPHESRKGRQVGQVRAKALFHFCQEA